MGEILPYYKKSIVDSIKKSIEANNANYYVLASNPIPWNNSVPPSRSGEYIASFYPVWSSIFGKKLFSGDIVPMIRNIEWASGTVYDRYDNTDEFLYSYDKNFYVVCAPEVAGGAYKIFKCIDNANGSPSVVKPDLVQPKTFQTEPDHYRWRYITSISTRTYDKFSTIDYIPALVNNSISLSASDNCGIDVVVIVNSGSGYATYHNGNVVSVITPTLLQIEGSASSFNDFYTKSAVYVYNSNSATSELFDITKYVSNTTGKFIYLNSEANTTNIEPGTTRYIISPKVKISTDGDTQPLAYCTVNSTANSINDIIVIESGSNITRANVEIIANNSFGSGANLYAIVPPVGGHGSDPAVELNMKAIGFGFFFANTEKGSIRANDVNFNQFAIVKDPHKIDANTAAKTYDLISTNTFSQCLTGTVTPSAIFSLGDKVQGANSEAIGIVVFSNSSVLELAGDKNFIDGEYIVSANGLVGTHLSITSRGSIYVKDLDPLYFQNINNVTRSNNKTESFKLIVTI